jgi:dTDP-4-dehydrorhamnose 3,5-epimerase
MSHRFDMRETPLSGCKVLLRRPVGDERGLLERLYCSAELGPLLGTKTIVQINRTVTTGRGIVRGMHFQYPPYAEVKLVTCLRGRVFDVAVDLRQGSPTFLEWHGEELAGSDQQTLLIPEGFAHGFQALSDECEMLYFHTAAHHPAAEGGVNARDPRLAISWPGPITGTSPRDAGHALIAPSFSGICV